MEAAARKTRQRTLQDRKKKPGFAGSVEIRYGRDPCPRKHNAKNSMVRETALSGVIADGSRCIEFKTTETPLLRWLDMIGVELRYNCCNMHETVAIKTCVEVCCCRFTEYIKQLVKKR